MSNDRYNIETPYGAAEFVKELREIANSPAELKNAWNSNGDFRDNEIENLID